MLESPRQAADELREYMAVCTNEKITQMAMTGMARILTAYDALFGAPAIDFWHEAPIAEDRNFIEAARNDSRVPPKYINIENMARRIDEIRLMKAPIHELGLTRAVHDYLSERQARSAN